MDETNTSNPSFVGQSTGKRLIDSILYQWVTKELNLLLSHKTDNSSGNQEGLIKDQRVWSPAECAQVMAVSIKVLYDRFKVFCCLLLR